MRILVISNLYPDKRQPLFGTFIAAHVAALQRAGAHVQVAAIRGVPVHRRVATKYLQLFVESFSVAVRAALRRRRFQLVEAHIAFPTVAIAWPVARLVGAKLVVYCHGSDVAEVGMRSAWHRWLARALFRRADLIVANSGHTAAVLADQYGIRGRKVVIWSPGIDPVFLGRRPVQRLAQTVLYVGRLDRGKGVEVLLEALAGLGAGVESVRIVGEGPERDRLMSIAARHQLPAAFVGALSPQLVADEMAAATVLVVPSTQDEGLGLVALEGMASGALVVATRSGGLAESVQAGQTGWLVEPGDVAALRDAIREALASGTEADRIRDTALARAREHDVDRVASTAIARYADLLGLDRRQRTASNPS